MWIWNDLCRCFKLSNMNRHHLEAPPPSHMLSTDTDTLTFCHGKWRTLSSLMWNTIYWCMSDLAIIRQVYISLWITIFIRVNPPKKMKLAYHKVSNTSQIMLMVMIITKLLNMLGGFNRCSAAQHCDWYQQWKCLHVEIKQPILKDFIKMCCYAFFFKLFTMHYWRIT